MRTPTQLANLRHEKTDMVGRVFGALTVLRESETRSRHREVRWICLCACSKEHVTSGSNLRRGHVQSCGCQRSARIIAKKTKHGHSTRRRHSPEYEIWSGMRKRCNCETSEAYRLYGARGIRVCERWEQFENFIADMGPRPSPSHSIDRIDNDGPYSPDNCRWATQAEQNRNTRSSRFVLLNGQRMVQADAARALGLKPSTITKMVKDGRLQRVS